jgi:DNA-binding response OmpR family regulator
MRATDLVKPALGGARVLVAGGDADDSAALTAVLRFNGFDAREARTAGEAFDAVSESHPAVLITDLDLPDDDDCALIRRVRRLPVPPAVVVVTGRVAEGIRHAATEAGAAAYFLKPAEPVQLVETVARLCATSE